MYESAEIHTVNKVKRSKWFYALPVIILLIPLFVGLSYKMLGSYGKKQEEPAAQESAATEQQAVLPDKTEGESVNNGNLTADMFVPTLPEKPESKPIYNGVRQVRTFEYIAGCIEGGRTGCTCYSHQGTALKEVTELMCKDYVKTACRLTHTKKKAKGRKFSKARSNIRTGRKLPPWAENRSRT